MTNLWGLCFQGSVGALLSRGAGDAKQLRHALAMITKGLSLDLNGGPLRRV